MMLQRWSRSSDNDPDPDEEWLEDEGDLKMRCLEGEDDETHDDPDNTEKKTVPDKLCPRESFLVKRECWC